MVKKIVCEVFSRCCGYFRPTALWNNGKQSEFNQRVAFDENKSQNSDYKKDVFLTITNS